MNSDAIKKIKFETKDGTGCGHLVFSGDMVGYHHISGSMPQARMVVIALLCDRCGYKAAQKYIKDNGRGKRLFTLSRRDGMSGSVDYWIQLFESYMNFDVPGVCKHLLHVSMYGTLNEGLRPLYVGDLVEVASNFLLRWGDRDRRAFKREGSGLKIKKLKRELLNKYGMKYIPENNDDAPASNRATNIFI